jgi:hypothetical protein
MNIETTFHLGQRLWPIVRLGDRSMVNPPFDCGVVFLDANETCYGFTRDYGFPEFNVFASEAEATAECDRRNSQPGKSVPIERQVKQ